MALSLWLAVRQAREAIRTGQPEEARRIVEPFVHEGYRKAIRVNREVATAYRLRAERHLRNDNPEAAWKDLLSAESLNTGEPDLTVLRKTLTKLGVAECRAALQAGKPMHVIDTLARLKQRTAYHPEFDALQDAANHWLLAREQADRGDFSTAMLTFDKTRLAEPNVLQFGFNDFTRELEDRQVRYQEAVSRLSEATQQQRWRDILLAADDVIAVAPNHREARQWKVKAWDTIPHEIITNDNVVSLSTTDFEVPKPLTKTIAGPIPIAKPIVSQSGVPKRFMLWIDGVGSYLVCLNARVTFGQATANGPVDVPIFADVSRIHAELARDGEGYILESAREVMVNGLATKRTTLKPGDRVTLGSTCQFQFHLPVPISPSARLELVSGHRLPVAVDGVLLMAETLILGAGDQAHVQLPDVEKNIVIYRTQDGLGIRHAMPFRIDHKPCSDRCTLPIPCHVEGEAFSFAVEHMTSHTLRV